ncbi:hypothetical protein Ciccas_011480 [Cichlidogyrus casuarinus]|uniref:Uncharacterized protein n=1 Tax=Cichlidogyrus casuarinus TaxID=1844966 RepID=A0ABD2PRJ3_9PLAT
MGAKSVWLIMAVMLALASSESNSDSFETSVEKKLIRSLMENYAKIGKIGRPVTSSSEVINVEFGLALSQILGLDETTQILTINSWTKYMWMDRLLTWEPKTHKGIKEVRIPPDRLWTPDIVLYNYADERLKEQRDVMVTVDYTGRVFWNPPAIFKSTCQIDITYFPFDVQSCYLKFASWTNDGTKLNLNTFDNEKEIDVTSYTDSHQWTLLAKPVRRFCTQSNANITRQTPNLTFFLLLKRNCAYYAYTLVLPCVLLSLLNLVIFWLPPTVPAKMILGMNIFVAFALLLRILARSTPTASINVPLLGYYYCLNMVLISLSTFFSIIVINLHFRCDKRNNLPDVVTKLVIKLARWVKVDCDLKLPPKKIKQNTPADDMLGMFPYGNGGISMQTNTLPQQKPKICPDVPAFASQTDTKPSSTEASPKQSTQQLESSLSEIRKALQNLVSKMDNKDKSAKKCKQWRMVALVLDRSFFWFYLCVIILSGLVMLIPRKELQTEEDVIAKHIKKLGNSHLECL